MALSPQKIKAIISLNDIQLTFYEYFCLWGDEYGEIETEKGSTRSRDR